MTLNLSLLSCLLTAGAGSIVSKDEVHDALLVSFTCMLVYQQPSLKLRGLIRAQFYAFLSNLSEQRVMRSC